MWERPFQVLPGGKGHMFVRGEYKIKRIRRQLFYFFEYKQQLLFWTDYVSKNIADEECEFGRGVNGKYMDLRGEQKSDESAVYDSQFFCGRSGERLGKHYE